MKRCRNGHLLTPENSALRPDGYRRCRLCLRARDLRWQRSEAGRVARARYNATEKKQANRKRYNTSVKGWATQRRYELKGTREAIEKRLAELAEEEEAWRTSLVTQTPMR